MRSWIIGGAVVLALAGGLYVAMKPTASIVVVENGVTTAATKAAVEAANKVADVVKPKPAYPPLDKAAYDAKLLALANLPKQKLRPAPSSTTASSTKPVTPPQSATTTVPHGPWPVRSAPYPNDGAVLPFHRVVAYYGNLYSKQMGVLGQYPEDEMLQRLRDTAAQWAAADTSTEVMPALDYIAVTAQGSAGFDGKYRARMPFSQIDKIIDMAKKVNGIVILDVQVGLSSVQTEVPLLEPYLKMPQVHLALDPEFDMRTGARPGTVIGTMDATEVNFAADYLAKLVRDNNLPPKMLIVHRFTQPMLTNARQIHPLPEVQVVLDADGFGSPAQKIGTYNNFVAADPIQFTGFKLFYKNDPSYGGRMMDPSEVLKLSPQPSFIQYQ